MTIGELAKLTNVSIDTLRYYEKVGLIPPVPRKANGIRNYDKSYVNWIQFIQNMKAAGLSLESILTYINLASLGANTSVQRKNLLLEAQDILTSKIQQLQMNVQKLNQMINNYHAVLPPAY